MNFKKLVLSVLFVSVAVFEASAVQINSEKELLIRDLSVVNDARATDANGPWSLGHLLTEMTPDGVDPADFVTTWINQWATVTSLNGFPVTPRPQVKEELLKQWPKRSDGKLDVSRAPFRLMAIVNRTDNEGTFTSGGAGEMRFEYCTYNRNGDPNNIEAPTPVNFLLLAEFLQPIDEAHQTDRFAWATRWHKLSHIPFGEKFNGELQGITDLVVKAKAMPNRNNGSSLNHLRTEEILVAKVVRNYRSFSIDSKGNLALTPLEQTPDTSFLTDPAKESSLVDWITKNVDAILNDNHVLPTEMLAGEAPGIDGKTSVSHFWGDPLLEETPNLQLARKKFATSSCTGCHNIFENKGSFLQMIDRNFNEKAYISDFVEQDLVRRALVLESNLSGNRSPYSKSASAH